MSESQSHKTSKPTTKAKTSKVKSATKPATKAATFAQYLAVTAKPEDRMNRYRGNSDLEAYVNSARSWVGICATMKAEQASSYPLRLYRRTKANSGKIVGKRLSDLKNPQNVGNKSALYAEQAGANVEEVYDHAALNCLRRPNPYTSGQELLYWIYLLEQIAGNAFLEVTETHDNAKPFAFYQMYPQNVGIVINENPAIPSLVSGYRYGRGTQVKDFGWEDVIHLKNAPSPFSPYWGASPLQLVLAEADLLEMATLNELSMWENGCAINLAYKTTGEETPEQLKQLVSQFESRHQGIDKSGRLFIGKGELKTIDASIKEMQYREGQLYYSQLILAAYRVPESKVRLNDANLAGSKTGNIEYLNESIRPMLVKMAEVLTEELLIKRLGVKPGEFWFAYDSIVPTDIASINAAAVGLVQNRIWTPDEARAELGYAPLPNGEGEKLVTPLGMASAPAPIIDGEKVPQASQGPALAGDAAQAVATPPSDLALNGAQIDSMLSIAQLVATGQLPPSAAREILFAAFPTVKVERIEAIIGGLSGFKPAAPEESAPKVEELKREPITEEPNVEPKALERILRHLAESDPREFFDRVFAKGIKWQTAKNPEGKSLKNQKKAADGLLVLGGRVLKAVDAHDAQGKAITDDVLKALIAQVEKWYLSADVEGGDAKARARDLQSILKSSLEGIFQAGGQEGLNTLAGIAGGPERIAETGASFEVIPENAIKFLEKYTVRLAQEITDTQQTDLKAGIAAALEQGMNPGEAKNAVKAALTEVAGWKAEQIANTEATRAYTQGNLAAWEEAKVERKQWLLSPDACSQCKGLAAKFAEPVSIAEPFLRKGDSWNDDLGNAYEMTYGDVDAPPLHPLDRCDIVPVL